MIIFTHHALQKLEQRGIPQRLVQEALNAPDYRVSSYSDRIVIYKKFEKLYLKVIYKEEGGSIIVITQYWTDKIKEI